MIYNELKQHGTADFPIELYHIDKFHTRYEMASHWHSAIELIRVISGVLNLKLNNREFSAYAGDIVFVNSETVHGAVPDECVYESLVFHVDALSISDMGCKFFIDNILNHEYIVNEYHPYKNDDFYKAVSDIFSAMENKSAGYKFTVIGNIYRLFGVIIDEHLYSESSSSSSISSDRNVPKLKSVLSFIRENYDMQISLDDMAMAAAMSPKYFCYFFRAMTRKTPVEYLNSYRIEKASRKLLNTDISVTDIAYSCGFNDLSYFIKTFKSIKGTTPSKFRKNPSETQKEPQ